MKNNQDFLTILTQISFPNARYLLGDRDKECPFLQFEMDGKDNLTGEAMTWRGRKWLLSRHMTDGEVVQTALAATLMAFEHEVRELFKYKGAALFQPHYDIDELVKFSRNQRPTMRTEIER